MKNVHEMQYALYTVHVSEFLPAGFFPSRGIPVSQESRGTGGAEGWCEVYYIYYYSALAYIL